MATSIATIIMPMPGGVTTLQGFSIAPYFLLIGDQHIVNPPSASSSTLLLNTIAFEHGPKFRHCSNYYSDPRTELVSCTSSALLLPLLLEYPCALIPTTWDLYTYMNWCSSTMAVASVGEDCAHRRDRWIVEVSKLWWGTPIDKMNDLKHECLADATIAGLRQLILWETPFVWNWMELAGLVDGIFWKCDGGWERWQNCKSCLQCLRVPTCQKRHCFCLIGVGYHYSQVWLWFSTESNNFTQITQAVSTVGS